MVCVEEQDFKQDSLFINLIYDNLREFDDLFIVME